MRPLLTTEGRGGAGDLATSFCQPATITTPQFSTPATTTNVQSCLTTRTVKSKGWKLSATKKLTVHYFAIIVFVDYTPEVVTSHAQTPCK